jgi:trimethylamine:corrinoid methyltransferase-like protein
MVDFQPIKSKLRSNVFLADQIAEIRAVTLHVLKTVGVHFPSERALRLFAEHGAQVNPESQILR